jgi:rRNA maturation endonuclease Nob1
MKPQIERLPPPDPDKRCVVCDRASYWPMLVDGRWHCPICGSRRLREIVKQKSNIGDCHGREDPGCGML